LQEKTIHNMKNQQKNRPLLSFDWAVKRLLRNKANYVVLEGFLSELLKRQIKVKQILESESNKEAHFDKLNRVDILVENDERELIIIELQFTSEFDYFHRMLYGASKVITQFIAQGDDYGKVRKVYSINIVYFNLGEGDDYVYHGRTTFRGLHTGDELQLTPEQREKFGMLEAGDLFPEYYILEVKRFNDIAKDTLDEWIYYLKHDAVLDDFKAQGLLQAREVLNFERLSDEEKVAYERALDDRRSKRSSIQTAKMEGLTEGRAEGLAEGKAIGLQEGRAEGLQEGIEKGKAEAFKEIVLIAHRSGHSVAQIQLLTGLSEEEVNKLLAFN
jgi:predicted transposase/invertase (TIGR01784 family)